MIHRGCRGGGLLSVGRDVAAEVFASYPHFAHPCALAAVLPLLLFLAYDFKCTTVNVDWR